jgi:hypothetical protein
MSFRKHFKSLKLLQKHLSECFMHAFEYFILIKFNSITSHVFIIYYKWHHVKIFF